MRTRLLQILQMLVRNKSPKLVALLLAVVTWFAIQPAISFEAVMSDVPVVVQVDTGWAVLEQSAASVDVHFRGSREGIRYLRQEQLEVLVDIRGQVYDEESLTIPLELRNVRAPVGVRAVFIRPSEISLSVDQEAEKRVPVRVHIQGSPPDGYEMELATAVPETVVISGPRQRLEAIDSVRTTPIDLEGRLQSFKLRVGLVPPSRAWVARVEPERVEVDITLAERSATAVFENVRVKSLTLPGQAREFEIRPSHVDVTLQGRSEVLETLTVRDVQAYVDATALEVGETKDARVRVHLPPRVRALQLVPEMISLTVSVTEPSSPESVEEDDL